MDQEQRPVGIGIPYVGDRPEIHAWHVERKSLEKYPLFLGCIEFQGEELAQFLWDNCPACYTQAVRRRLVSLANGLKGKDTK